MRLGKLGSRLLVTAGALWTLGMGWVVANTAAAYLRAGDEPAAARVADAPAERWIRIEDARLRCDTRIARENFAYFLGEGADGKNPFVAQLPKETSCEGAKLEGGFIPGTFTRAWLKDRLGVELPGDGELRFFTHALAPEVLRGVLARTILLLLAGLLVLGFALRAMKRLRREAAAPAARTR
jgi:hypothetical protein